MLTLSGFSASNYYNKVKLALLEKGVPFEEELAWVGATDAAASPLGKVPYLKTPDGAMCESAVMLEYIEQKYPQNPLLPADPFAAAKVRELALFRTQGEAEHAQYLLSLPPPSATRTPLTWLPSSVQLLHGTGVVETSLPLLVGLFCLYSRSLLTLT